MHRGRFAPTPSGELHMGSLVCALASYLDARKSGGEWILRIEDVDTARCRPKYETSLLRQLERHGLHWDGPVLRQSERRDVYLEHIHALQRQGRVYSCTCSRSFLKSQRCQTNPEGEYIYPGYCRSEDGLPVKRATGRPFALRFSIREPEYAFDDLLVGHRTGRLDHECGDFVVLRADGCVAYHLAVVVDDAHQGVTRVVRGADILPLTGRHLLLQQALGLPSPQYAHIPLVCAPDGRKLSKSASAEALAFRSEMTNLGEALSILGYEIRLSDFASADEILGHAVGRYQLT